MVQHLRQTSVQPSDEVCVDEPMIIIMLLYTFHSFISRSVTPKLWSNEVKNIHNSKPKASDLEVCMFKFMHQLILILP